MSSPLRLFYHYADPDQSLLDDLEIHLTALKSQGVLASWTRSQVLAGSMSQRTVHSKLVEADLILLLVSKYYMAQCFETLQPTLARHAAGEVKAAAVLLRPVDINGSVVEQLPLLPGNGRPVTRWRNRDEAWHSISLGIRQLVQSTLPLIASTRRRETRVGSAPAYSASVAASTAAATGARRAASAQPDVDVFLVYHAADELQVLQISEALKQRGIRPWLECEEIAPGRWVQEALQEAIARAKSAVVLLGEHTCLGWQRTQLRALLSRCVHDGTPVIPVLLPGVQRVPDDFLFLQQLSWIHLDREGWRGGLDRLEWGITGKRPQGRSAS